MLEKHLASRLPLRLPHWRLNRVTEMLRHRPQPLWPRWKDDHPIRIYRRMLLATLAAGDDQEQVQAIEEELPAVHERTGIITRRSFAGAGARRRDCSHANRWKRSLPNSGPTRKRSSTTLRCFSTCAMPWTIATGFC